MFRANSFGVAVRAARRSIDKTLSQMANELECSIAFLSAIETGRTKIPKDRIKEFEQYFKKYGVTLEQDLYALAEESSDKLSLEGLSQQHRLLLTGLAKSHYTDEQLQTFAKFLETINTRK